MTDKKAARTTVELIEELDDHFNHMDMKMVTSSSRLMELRDMGMWKATNVRNLSAVLREARALETRDRLQESQRKRLLRKVKQKEQEFAAYLKDGEHRK